MAEGEGWPGERASSILGDLWSSGSGLTAKYKRPVLIELRDELPKNAVGKIDKPALRELAQRQPM